MRTADGTPVRIDSLKVGDTMMYDVVAMQIVEGNNGDMWVTSSTNGVIRIQGSGNSLKEYTVSGYSLANDKLNSLNSRRPYILSKNSHFPEYGLHHLCWMSPTYHHYYPLLFA